MTGPKYYTPTPRDLAILEALQTGATYAEVGAAHGISRQRVKQILNHLEGFGLSVNTAALRAGHKADEVARQRRERYGEHYTDLQENPEMRRIIGQKLRQKRHNAQSKGIHCNLKLSDLYPLPEFCPALGIRINYHAGGPVDDAMSIDRLDPALGYVSGNIVIVCFRANRIKNNANLAELKRLVEFYEPLLNP